jgi:hypothetical protein
MSSIADIIGDIESEIDDCEHALEHAISDMRSAIAHEPRPASDSDDDYYGMLRKGDEILSAIRSNFAEATNALSDAVYKLHGLG